MPGSLGGSGRGRFGLRWLPAAVGTLLLLASLGVYYCTVVRIDLPHSFFYNLMPEPDAEEYFAGAVALHTEGRYQIHVAGKELPPRYPFGYSAAMLPLFWLAVEPIRIPFLTNQILGGVLIALTFMSLAHTSILAGGLASLLLATFPAFIVLVRSPTSEVSSAVLILAAFMAMHRCLQRRRRVWGIVGALLLGMSACIRVNTCFLFPVFFLVPFAHRAPKLERLRTALLFSSAFALGVAPVLWWNYRTFGNILTSGYNLWIPRTFSWTFGVSYLGDNLHYMIDELFQSETVPRLANIFGNGSYFTVTIVVLVVLAAILNRRSPTFWALALPCVAFLIVMMFYFFQDARLFFPIMVLAIPLVAITWARRLGDRGKRDRKSVALTMAMAALLTAHVVGYPAKDGTLELGYHFKMDVFGTRSVKYELMTEFRHCCLTNEETVIFSDMNPPYVHAFAGDASVFPSSPTHDYRFANKGFSFGDADRQAALDEAAGRSAGTYCVLIGQVDQAGENCPVTPGWKWSTVFENEFGSGIAQLISASR